MQLTAERWLGRLLRRNPQQPLYDAAEAVLILILAFQCVRLVWIVLAPVEPAREWQAASPSLHAGKLTVFDPFFRTAPSSGVSTVTSLPLKLFGVRVDQATGRGSAIIAAADGVQQSYAIGDEVMPGVHLKAVTHDSVTIDRAGAEEQLFLDQSPAPSVTQARSSESGVPFGRPEVRANVASPDSEFIFTPRVRNGVASGFAVVPRRAIGPYREAGFLAGDVVTQINGATISSAKDAESMIANIPAGTPIFFTVERAGKIITLNQKSLPR
jgi:general secretion pathway protein C